MRCPYQDMHTIRADASDREGGHQAEVETGVHERHRHSQDTTPEGSLQEMDEGVHVPGMKAGN